MQQNYFVYIVTNPSKSTLYIGVTNDLRRRLREHYESRDKKNTFAGRYHCYHLIYYESFFNIDHAIEREKEIKKWRREKKEKLITASNPGWNFFDDHIWEK